MRVVVEAIDGFINISLQDAERENENLNPAVGNRSAILSICGRVSENAFRAAIRQSHVTTRGWEWDNVYRVAELLDVLRYLGRELTTGQLCQAIAAVSAGRVIAQMHYRGRAIAQMVIANSPDGLIAELPEPNLTQLPAYLSISGQLYRLELAGEGDIAQAIRAELEVRVREHGNAVRQISQSMNEEVDRRVAEVEARYRRTGVPVPQLTPQDVARGLQLSHFEDGLAFYLPFSYRPRYLVPRGRADVRYALPGDVASSLERRLKIAFTLTRAGWRPPHLTDEHLSFFDHYHQGCWGSLSWAETVHQVPADLYPLRDRMEAELEVVNGDSLARRSPQNLPGYMELEAAALALGQQVEVWDSGPAPAVEPQGQGQERRRGWRA